MISEPSQSQSSHPPQSQSQSQPAILQQKRITRQQWFRHFSSQNREQLLQECSRLEVTLPKGYAKKSLLIDLLIEKNKKLRRKSDTSATSIFQQQQQQQQPNSATQTLNPINSVRRKTSLRKKPSIKLVYLAKPPHGSVCAEQGPREYMEDTFVVAKYDDMVLYGVFDGHGGDYVSKKLPNLMAERLMKGLPSSIRYKSSKLKRHILQTCQEIDQNLSKEAEASEAGSTVTMILHVPPMLYTINIGDSRTIIAKKKKNQTSQGYQIVLETQDHKPNLTREYQRIVQAGGRVTKEEDDDYRVNDVLAMSRAMGDHELKDRFVNGQYGPVSSQPDIQSISLQPEEKYVAILASDGLWDVVKNEQSLKFVHHFGLEEAASSLTNYALSHDSMDNITVLTTSF